MDSRRKRLVPTYTVLRPQWKRQRPLLWDDRGFRYARVMGTVLPGVIAFVVGTALAVAPHWCPGWRCSTAVTGRSGSAGACSRSAPWSTRSRSSSYTLLPLPDDVSALCPGPSPQLVPFTFCWTSRRRAADGSPVNVARQPGRGAGAVQRHPLHAARALVRHAVLRRRWLAGLLLGTVVGFGVSLLVECTQFDR